MSASETSPTNAPTGVTCRFDSNGNETRTDFFRMMDIVMDAGYNGYVGIEYEGNRLSEDEGIIATKKLLEKIINS